MEITLDLLCRRLHADLPAGADPCRPIRSLLTDSRSLAEPEGTLFFAISTATNDGARYIPYLYSRGVRTFVVPATYIPPLEIAADPQAIFIHVDDSIRALQLAARRTAPAPGSHPMEVIAVTGSRGKTVVKEWLYQALEPLHHVVRSPRSFNSQIGVPLSMTEILPDTDIAIIEAGISRQGEMAALRDTILPDTVILTNIAADHDDGFTSRRQKIEEKISLASAASLLIYRADDPELDQIIRDTLLPTVTLLPWRLQGDPLPGQLKFTPEQITDLIHLTDPADIENAGHILAYLTHRGYTPEQIRQAFSRLHPIATRLNVIEGSNACNIVYDSYTSDVSSLLPALDFIARRRMPSRTLTVILSDIRHESHHPDAYSRIASMLRTRGVARFIGIGENLCAHADDFTATEQHTGWDRPAPMACEFFPTTEAFMAAHSAADFRSEIILIKGAPEYQFGRILEILEARTHETVLEVNLDAMKRNFNYFRSQVPTTTGLIAMVKASGYGAGSYEIAKTLQDAGAAYLAVAVLDEGVDLRRNGITMPIMVMNPRVANYKMMFANRLEPEIYTFSMLTDVIRAARRNGIRQYPIHVKLDTGMHRMGFTESELPLLLQTINAAEEIRIESVFSHLATADCPDMDTYTEQQLATFRRCTDYMLANTPRPFKRHILNTAGILRYPDHHYDMVRLGIGLYGVNTLPPDMERPLELVSSLKTIIISLREWPAGETIGYGRRGLLTRPSRIATIPIGYADGMNRHFGNGAIRLLVNGHPAPTIGNICMDACMIDVTDIPCREGDTVEIFSPRTGIRHLADHLRTIPYEILTSVSPRVKRVYYTE